ncbi:MAG: hypothetical protein QOE71_108 [Pseudonocardiales bacterium]|jgi:hypothetical protein|nr:hypothetical protein [Pseudonocardiales bacterium]
MTARPSKRTTLIGGGVVAVLAVGAFSAIALIGNNTKKPVASPASSTTASPTPSPTPKPKPKPKPKPVVNYLNGIGAASKTPVIAVKIDDTENGRPSVGLNKADIVYIEQAEGGLTRLLAVFGTNKPTVEPVRSARASDAELLSQYGKISLVASGGGGDSLPTLDRSVVKGVINDRGGPGFFRDNNRPAPYNLGSNLAQVAAATKTAPAKNVGFSWAATDTRLARAKNGASVNTMVGGTPVSFRWNTGRHRYVRTISGSPLTLADGNSASTPNVLVQLCRVATDYTDVDVAGNPSQYTHSVGSGRVVLFRNGKRIEGKWSRPNEASPTKYTDLAGRPLLLAPGGAYVVLATNGAPV